MTKLGDEDSVGDEVSEGKGDGKDQEEEGTKARQAFEKQAVAIHEEESDDCFHGLLKQAAWDNAGLPMVCHWQNKQKSFADGGGLNSPGRWAPENRGVNMDSDKRAFVDKMALMLRTFLMKHLPDLKRATFQLATGNMMESPFDEKDLEKLREEWFSLLGGAASLRVRTPHQPFWLFAVEETLQRMGDEDSYEGAGGQLCDRTTSWSG